MNDMTKGRDIFLALNLDAASRLRRIAATVAFRYLLELHNYGYVAATQASLGRICRRFRLGDFIMACAVHYPCR